LTTFGDLELINFKGCIGAIPYIGVTMQLWGIGACAPIDLEHLNFSLNFRAAESLTAT